MATSALVIFEKTPGLYVGTRINREGFDVPEILAERFGDDVEALKSFIDAGSVGGGYASARDTETLCEPNEASPTLILGAGTDVTYMIAEDGGLFPVELEPAISVRPVSRELAELPYGRYFDGTYEWDYDEDGWEPLRAPYGMPPAPSREGLKRGVTSYEDI